MSQKYHVSRSEILEKINIADKYDQDKYPTAAELENAIAKLDLIKERGLIMFNSTLGSDTTHLGISMSGIFLTIRSLVSRICAVPVN
jgi:hypothetical protein